MPEEGVSPDSRLKNTSARTRAQVDGTVSRQAEVIVNTRFNHSTNQTRPIRLNGRTVAVLRGRVLDVRRHTTGLLQKPPGIALAVDLLNKAEAFGADYIDVWVTDWDQHFRIGISEFRARGFILQRAKFERQIACPFTAFATELEIKSTALRAGEVKFRPAQPALFALDAFTGGGAR
jgi:hypothetical protein